MFSQKIVIIAKLLKTLSYGLQIAHLPGFKAIAPSSRIGQMTQRKQTNNKKSSKQYFLKQNKYMIIIGLP